MIRPKHELAGKVVRLRTKDGKINTVTFTVEDWWHNVYGESWMDVSGNPACIQYAIRSGISNLPMDNEVVYGKINGLGYLIHTSELGEVIENN